LNASDLNTPWRISAGTIYGPPLDGKIYGAMEIDVTEAIAFINKERASGLKLTLTHLTTSVLAKVYAIDVPELNCYTARGRFFRRPSVLAGITILQDESGELGMAMIDDADKKSLAIIVQETRAGMKTTRSGAHGAEVENKHLLAKIPWPFRMWLYKFVRLSVLKLGLNLPFLGITPLSFGSFCVSNIGALGVSFGLGALLPPSNLSALFTMGKPEQRVVVRDGEMVIRTMMTLGATFDHRIVDGYHAGQLVKAVHRRFKAMDW
jgi:pyruvate dehydrogenase E2 component (dihydrolipoamide acetyltransferase)